MKNLTPELKKIINDEIEYYNDYKKNLIQFVIHCSSYGKNTKLHKRIRLDSHEMLSIQKEISRMEIFIYDLKLMINGDNSVFNYVFNKHFN
jgi:hypothetical protein